MINKPIGLQYLNIKNNRISLRANARILNENYKQGICLNTIDQVNDILKKNGLELHQDFMKESDLSLAHVKDDVEVSIDNLISELSMIESNKYFKVQRDNSITFENRNKWDNMNAIFYGKFLEMSKINKPKYKGLNINTDEFIDVTRMETRYNDWRTVKKFLGTRNMMEILEQVNVNYLTLINILKGHPMETPKVDISDFKTLSELKYYAFISFLNEQCNGDYTAIQREITQRLGENTKASYQMKKIREMLPLVQNPEGRKLDSIMKLREEIKE